MSYDKMDSSAVYALFEEIKSKLDKRTEQAVPITPAAPAIRPEDIAGIQEMTATLKEVAETVSMPQKHIHKYTIDLKANRMLLILGFALTVIIILAYIISHQRQTIGNYTDNDLRYRYIQMNGAAAPEDILMLREVFDYDRNPESIRLIRKQVEKYEQLIMEQAETEARAKLNSQQAEQIRQEAESIKGKK